MSENVFVGPDFIVCVGLAEEFCSIVYELQFRQSPRTIVRMVRGKNMMSPAALFDEFAAALQFPCYFGNNWNAFDECIADLEWLPGQHYIIAIVDASQVLRDEPVELEVFFRIMRSVAREWRDKRGRGFQVMLQCTTDDTDDVRQAFGASVDAVLMNEVKSVVTFDAEE
jgi:hypothetical protein